MFSSNLSQACFVPQLLINRIAIVIWIQWTDLLLAYVYNSDKSFGSCLEPMACNSCMQTGHIYHKSWFCQRKVEVLQLFKQTSYWVGNCSYEMAHFLTSSFGYWTLYCYWSYWNLIFDMFMELNGWHWTWYDMVFLKCGIVNGYDLCYDLVNYGMVCVLHVFFFNLFIAVSLR